MPFTAIPARRQRRANTIARLTRLGVVAGLVGAAMSAVLVSTPAQAANGRQITVLYPDARNATAVQAGGHIVVGANFGTRHSEDQSDYAHVSLCDAAGANCTDVTAEAGEDLSDDNAGRYVGKPITMSADRLSRYATVQLTLMTYYDEVDYPDISTYSAPISRFIPSPQFKVSLRTSADYPGASLVNIAGARPNTKFYIGYLRSDGTGQLPFAAGPDPVYGPANAYGQALIVVRNVKIAKVFVSQPIPELGVNPDACCYNGRFVDERTASMS